MHHRMFTCIALALLLALTIAPDRVRAAESPLGTLKPITSWHQDYIRSWNGKPMTVCQSEQESWERLHQTCHQLVDGPAVGQGSDLVAGRVLDDIIYDGNYYSRVDAEPTWKSGSLDGFKCDYACWLESYATSYIVSDLGRTTINSTPVRHIQFWSTDAKLNESIGGQYVDDYFISDDGTMIANGFSYRGDVPGYGQGEMSFLWVNSNFNAPIKVGAPDASLVQPDK